MLINAVYSIVQNLSQSSATATSRHDNPTRVLLEETVFDLERKATQDTTEIKGMTCAFASGMMAASSIVLAHTLPLTVLLPRDLYHGVSTVMMDVFQERFGVQVRRVDMTDLQLLEKELAQLVQQQTSGSILLWMESPSNPQTHIIDFQAVCQLVAQIKQQDYSNKHVTITTVVDSTLAPPVIQQPLLFGVDIVMHSGTKYIAGHSDALLGIVTASPYTEQGRRLGPLIHQVQVTVGGVASPMDSWLALRGLRTLHVRVERQCQTALTLARHLSSTDSLIRHVHYPGLPTHPGHAIAKRQMKEGCYGGVLSVEFHSEHMAMAFAGALRTMIRGTSLGGTETLIEERRSIEPEGRQTSPPGLLRISVGLEDAQDLIRDVDMALSIAKQVQEEMV
jgi:cystathionine gamma-synthase